MYALSGVLYTLLTGRLPYPREQRAATTLAHLQDPPPRPSDTHGDLEPFDSVVAGGMAKTWEDRLSLSELIVGAQVAARRWAGSEAPDESPPPTRRRWPRQPDTPRQAGEPVVHYPAGASTHGTGASPPETIGRGLDRGARVPHARHNDCCLFAYRSIRPRPAVADRLITEGPRCPTPALAKRMTALGWIASRVASRR